MGGKLVLVSNFPGRGDDDDLFQGLGNIKIEAHVSSGMGHPRRQLGAVKQNAIGPADAAPTAYYLIKKVLVLGEKVLPW